MNDEPSPRFEIRRAVIVIGQREPRRWRVSITLTEDDRRYSLVSPLLDQYEAHRWKARTLRRIWDDEIDVDELHEITTYAEDGGFGYWAGPLHETEGHGHPGCLPLVVEDRRYVSVDTHGYDQAAPYGYTRRRIPGEW